MKRSGGYRLLAVVLALCLTLGGGALAAPAGATVWGYSEGLAQCELGGKWGYVNGKKEVVIPLQYDSIVSFTLGVAAVNLGGKLGVIRQDGAYLLQPEYDTLMPIDCGLYIAQKGGGWGVVSILPYMDGRGNVTNVIYDLTYSSVTVEEQGGTRVLTLTNGDGAMTRVPVFDLPALLVRKGVPSAQFPLTRGKLPSFSDVSQKDWYALWVDVAYNVGLVSGVGNNRFNPNGTITVAEAIQLAATIESRYRDDSFHTSAQTGPNWYTGAVNYCIASGVIRSGQFSQSDYTRPITRLEMAQIFAATSPVKDMPVLNSASRVRSSIPDVKSGSTGAESVYALYEKGILSGVDSSLTFNPTGTMTRAEAAALAARIARAEQRIALWRSYDSAQLVK